MLNFIDAKLLIDFWECIAPASIPRLIQVDDLVKLKIEGVSAHEMDWPPPVAFHDFLWIRVTSINGDVCNGTVISRPGHVDAWMAAETFKRETDAVFSCLQIHDIKRKNS